MVRHWWRRSARAATANEDVQPWAARPPETEEQARTRQADTIIGVGRILRRLQYDATIPATGGEASACGAGTVPVDFAVAAADLDDARQAHAARPDDPTIAAALDAATTALVIQFQRLEQPV